MFSQKYIKIVLAISVSVLLLALIALIDPFKLTVEDGSKDQVSVRIFSLLENGEVYSESNRQPHAHIDRDAEFLQQLAHSMMPGGDLNEASRLLEESIYSYSGPQGYHYFILHDELAALKGMQGDIEAQRRYRKVAMQGRARLLQTEVNL